MSNYVFDYDWEQGRRRIGLLEELADPSTFRRMGDLGVTAGWSCLEVGGGAGSVARWLCRRVGERGRVLAIDLDTRFLDEIDAANLEVRRHDVTAGGLPEGEFDLVHARAVLMHLPDRERVVADLVASLRPGGWLFLEDADSGPLDVYASGLYRDAWRASIAVQERAGISFTWARRMPSVFTDLGLTDVGAECVAYFVHGDSPGMELSRLTWQQVLDRVDASDEEREIVKRAVEAVDDPAQWFGGPGLVAAWGRRPL